MTKWKGLFVKLQVQEPVFFKTVEFWNSRQDGMSAFIGLRIVVIDGDTSMEYMSYILCFVTSVLIFVT